MENNMAIKQNEMGLDELEWNYLEDRLLNREK